MFNSLKLLFYDSLQNLSEPTEERLEGGQMVRPGGKRRDMSKHNSPYSSGVIKGVLTDMVDCIKELLLDGKSVKIDDLAIFGVGIRSKAAETLEEFSLEKNITGMRLKARATGNLSTTNLKLDSQLKQQAEYQKPTTPGGGSGSGNTPDPKPNPDEGDEEAPDPTV